MNNTKNPARIDLDKWLLQTKLVEWMLTCVGAGKEVDEAFDYNDTKVVDDLTYKYKETGLLTISESDRKTISTAVKNFHVVYRGAMRDRKIIIRTFTVDTENGAVLRFTANGRDNTCQVSIHNARIHEHFKYHRVLVALSLLHSMILKHDRRLEVELEVSTRNNRIIDYKVLNGQHCFNACWNNAILHYPTLTPEQDTLCEKVIRDVTLKTNRRSEVHAEGLCVTIAFAANGDTYQLTVEADK